MQAWKDGEMEIIKKKSEVRVDVLSLTLFLHLGHAPEQVEVIT